MTRTQNAKSLDQYFTKEEVAKEFVDQVDQLLGFQNFDFIVEPSMGEGAIYENLPFEKRRGVDVDKMHPDCLEMNFLKWHPEHSGIPFDRMLGVESRILFIGNPPFGSNSSLSVEFFKHASKFSDSIAFLVPITWQKFSVQKRIPKGWGLFFDEILPDESFVFEGESYSVRCCKQIWSKNPIKRN